MSSETLLELSSNQFKTCEFFEFLIVSLGEMNADVSEVMLHLRKRGFQKCFEMIGSYILAYLIAIVSIQHVTLM